MRSPVVDSHVHAFSPDMLERRLELVKSDFWFGELYSSPSARLTTANDLVDSMNESDVDISVMCGFPWSDPGSCGEHNDYMAVAAGEHSNRLRWLATVLPGDPDAPRQAEQCFRAGAVGIGELNADAQGFDLAEPGSLAPLVEVCEAWDRPIMFHISEPVGHMYPGKGTATPARLLRFLERFPGVKVIAAHWGGGLPFYELMPEVCELTRNVVYDSAASTYLYRFPVFRSAIEIAGPSRVLFGSDYPVLGQKKLHRRVRSLALPEDVHRMIMGDNARSFLQFS